MGGSVARLSEQASVGHPEIDAQHRRLIELADVVAGLSGTADHGRIEAAFDEVVRYTIKHFQFEQEALRLAGYPGLAGHICAHQAIIDRVDDLYARRFSVTAEELLDVLLNRIIGHILTVDPEFRGIFTPSSECGGPSA
jgi:hemerythrin-like metal-binding protein